MYRRQESGGLTGVKAQFPLDADDHQRKGLTEGNYMWPMEAWYALLVFVLSVFGFVVFAIGCEKRGK
jgi:hypothetical protein